jgi:hypothetical protein
VRPHPRQKATHRDTAHDEPPYEALQGAYGSGGSYGVGGGFADDEPGSKAEESRDTVPEEGPARDTAPDVHTRASEVDEALGEVRRAVRERKAGRASRDS